MRFKKLFSFCLIIAAAFLLTACNDFMEKEEHEHKVSVEWSNDASNHWHTCEGCDDLLDKTAHVFGEWEVKVEATEETVGSKERTCSVCEYVETEEIAKLEHTHTPGAEATCTTDQTCTSCGEILVAKKGHTEEVVKGYAATCEAAGLTDGKKCSVCGEILLAQEEIPALGHKNAEPLEENRVESTCVIAGSYDSVIKCSVCEKELSRETKALELAAHTEEVVAGKAATCEATGLTEGKKCSVCDKELLAQEEIPALGHKPGPMATCTTDQTCERCGEVLEAKKGHTEEKIPAVEPSCGAAGLTEGKKCSVCGEILLAQQEIPALRHIADEAVIENMTPATDTDAEHYDSVVYCSVCRKELSRTKTYLTLAAPEETSTLSDDELENNNVDIVRGLYGDAELVFTYSQKIPYESRMNDWSIGRVYLLHQDTGKYKTEINDPYARLLAKPNDHFLEMNKMFYHNSDSQYGCWFPSGMHAEHMKDALVTVTITRVGELVRAKVVATCNSHENCINENNYTFYLESSKAINVVLANTWQEITVLDVNVKKANNATQLLAGPIKVDPNDGNLEQSVYLYTVDPTINAQKVTYNFHMSNCNWNENTWGYWRIWLWQGEAGPIQRLMPVADEAQNPNLIEAKWTLNGGEHGPTAQGMYLWPKNPDGSNADAVGFDKLLLDCDVKIEFSKIGRFILIKFTYYNNPNFAGVYATRYYGGHMLNDNPFTIDLITAHSSVELTSLLFESL